MKLKLKLISLITVVALAGCGKDSSSNSSNSSNSADSKKETIDITNRSFIGGIEANTGDIYKLKQEDTGYSMKSLTITNSATKDCRLKIIKLQSDWMDEMETRYQYGSVFNLKSSSDDSIKHQDGAYVFPYDTHDFSFLIYFMSGGKVGNFVDFTLNCEDRGE